MTKPYEYKEETHQVGDGIETFWSNVLGCTVVIIYDKDGISVSLVDQKCVHYTTLGGGKP